MVKGKILIRVAKYRKMLKTIIAHIIKTYKKKLMIYFLRFIYSFWMIEGQHILLISRYFPRQYCINSFSEMTIFSPIQVQLFNPERGENCLYFHVSEHNELDRNSISSLLFVIPNRNPFQYKDTPIKMENDFRKAMMNNLFSTPSDVCFLEWTSRCWIWYKYLAVVS